MIGLVLALYAANEECTDARATKNHTFPRGPQSRSLGVNPLFTITALAERAMLHFAADHGLSFDAEAVNAPPVGPREVGLAAA